MMNELDLVIVLGIILDNVIEVMVGYYYGELMSVIFVMVYSMVFLV